MTADRSRRVFGAGLLAVVPLAFAAAALLSVAQAHAAGSAGWACPLLAITGVVCPFCGLTHASIALAQGDVLAALGHHPLVFGLAAAWVWTAVELVRARPSRAARWAVQPRVLLGALLAVWAVNIAAHAWA